MGDVDITLEGSPKDTQKIYDFMCLHVKKTSDAKVEKKRLSFTATI